MDCPAEVLQLIERFELHRAEYMRDSYNETQTRREFIDPLFKALGWDIDNAAGLAEAYKDVIHEDAIKVGGKTKAPDYCFRIGGTRKFFLEAKKPSAKLKDDKGHAFQLRRYAWSAKLPISIITNFAEIVVYDCRIKPDEKDKAGIARTIYFRYDELPAKWSEFAAIFSRDAILKGSFDRYVESNKKKRGTAEVDAAFLAEIEGWRSELARNLALRNDDLSQRDLNFAVQRIIDRIIFLRIAEDRGIEPYGQLQALLNGERVYKRLGELFHAADDRYNSSIFHFSPEKGRREPPDELTLGLAVDDKILKDILRGLYYPDSPYEFSVLGADILGQVYEQFLGKVISLTAGHRAKVEDKPEVKKAGGVYYTPTYIVEYIVRQTVGELLTGKTPKQAAKLRILDPACGSGSFLLGAYQFLLDWHLKWYLEDGAKKHPKELYQVRVDQWRLTTAVRKEILLNNIYGVDIDTQAVEVTKLSLLLKVLEGATSEALERQRRMFHERALPDLGNNIKCGNSLIGPDFYREQQLDLFDDEERYRINAFDWHGQDGFAAIMKAGGFDAVIGNPPYVRQEGVSAFKEYFKKNYKSYHGLADLYVYFIEKEFYLLKESGLFGMICSGKFTQTGYGEKLREFILTQSIECIVNYLDSQIFEGATTYPLIIIAKRDHPNKKHSISYSSASNAGSMIPDDIIKSAYKLKQDRLKASQWVFTPESAQEILSKMEQSTVRLAELVGPAQLGIKTSFNEAFVVNEDLAKTLIKQDKNANEIIRPYLRGRDLSKWLSTGKSGFIVCARESIDIDKYPSIKKHLLNYEKQLKDRYEVKRGDYAWWVIRQVADISIYENAKIIYPDLCTRSSFALNFDSTYPNNTVFCLPTSNTALLALLNSKLLWFWINRICPANRGGAYRLCNQYINRIPLPNTILGEKKLIEYGRQQVEFAKQLKSKYDHAKTVIQRQIDALDRQIDQLVYELYGLTDDEIRIVEEATQ